MQNHGKWKTRIIENIFVGKDNSIRSYRILTGKSVNKRPIQLLYPMELHCDPKTTTSTTQDDKILNVNTEELQPKRLTPAVSGKRIRDIAENENQ